MPDTSPALSLRPFTPRDADAICDWPRSLYEAQHWAGPNTAWPLPSAVFERWHADGETVCAVG